MRSGYSCDTTDAIPLARGEGLYRERAGFMLSADLGLRPSIAEIPEGVELDSGEGLYRERAGFMLSADLGLRPSIAEIPEGVELDSGCGAWMIDSVCSGPNRQCGNWGAII
jgi:hypothetical protein